MDEKHILVSLGDEKAKQISEVIGSKSCNKILDLLADKDLTVSEISRKLKMPINTVDYNVKKLVKAGLIEKASHWWSVKGKKMLTYKVSNKKIIISPRKSVAKVFAWTLGLTGLTALTIRELLGRAQYVAGPAMDSVRNNAFITETTLDSAPIILGGAENGVGFLSFIAGISPWSWFLMGAWFAVFLFFVFILYTERRKNI